MFQQTFSLEKLSEFVGRETMLQTAQNWMKDGNFHLVFFSGEYGIGKTRLLQKILDLALRELKYDGSPTHLIDLYHFRHHSPEGLARAIFKCFEKTDNEHYFNAFITAQRRLDAARTAGDSKAIREHLQKLLDSCADSLKEMSTERGVLLLFDTVEQFVYPTGTRFAPAWNWLKGWIGNLTRGLVIFAGRPQAEVLYNQVSSLTIPLDFFSPEESRSYLLATANRWSQEKGLLVSFAEEDAQKLHELSQGRPILLAIFLELRMRDPQAFKDLSELRTETFEQKIIDYLLSLPELGETLKAAGRTPKGISSELLAKIRGISIRESTQALDILRNMSFAKTFPEDSTQVFLHDEMYVLLKRYVYSTVADTAERQEAAQIIYDYYRQSITRIDKELRNIFAGLLQEVDFKQSTDILPDYISKIRELETYRQRLKTESIYYRLRHQLKKEGKTTAEEEDSIFEGLKRYYRFAHEAATSNNDEILLPLQIELTNFWLSLNNDNYWKPFIEGLLTIHEVWLKVATGQNFVDDIPDHIKSLAGISNLSADHEAILRSILEVWLGSEVYSKQAAYDRAEEAFTTTINEMQNLHVDKHTEWFKGVVISLAYRQRAYLRRIRGLLEIAIQDFKQGLYYSKLIHFDHEEATLRNDLGFAEMKAGLLLSAFENMWHGLQLRYDVSIAHRIALSHSSLAQYFIATGAYEEARKHAQYTLKIAGIVGFRRGLGLGNLALAEATRRFAFSAQAPSNQAEYLQQAQDAIDIAIFLLEQTGERARVIDANLEQACLYRDRLRIEPDLSKKRAWFEKANHQFRWVANAAEEAKIEYRLVDAMNNLIWLGYFANELEYAEHSIQEFERLEVLQSYWFRNGKFVNEMQARKNPQIWEQIGKYCVGRGMTALERWKNDNTEKRVEFLKDAARYMMLGLLYSTSFAEDHRGLREGRRTLLQALTKLGPEDLRQFCNLVLEAEIAEKVSKKPSALQNLVRDYALWFGS